MKEIHKKTVTNFVTCCKLTLKDGAVFGFTNGTENFLIDKILYKPSAMSSVSGIETSDKFSVDNLEIKGILNSDEVKEQDILAGKYDSAEVEIFTADVRDTGFKVVQRKGWLGEVNIQDGEFVAEIRGLTQKLQCKITELYSPKCRANFGDSRCKMKLSEYTVKAIVKSVDKTQSRQVFQADTDKPNGYFSLGLITWTSGKNKGVKMEIKESFLDQFILSMPLPERIQAGDEFEAVAGCDKEFSTCFQKFKNAINFRGEPHLPGNDKILETGSTRKK